MATDFANAHDRHRQDAEFLENATRLPNADHLYGFAAECGLKALMTVFGMPVTGTGDPRSRDDRVHIDRLWARYPTYLSSQHVADYPLDVENYFDDWRAGDRYEGEGHVTSPRLSRHRHGAEHVRALVARARMEGLLT